MATKVVDLGSVVGPKGDKGETGPQGAPGADGKDGKDGAAGAAGKSAYQCAVEGGYTGTEAEFAALLANIPTSDHKHAAGDITGGTLGSERLPTVPVSKGGTGATTTASARSNLGAAPIASPVFTGTPKAPTSSTSYTTYQLRNVALVTELPSSIGNGQIAFIYE